MCQGMFHLKVVKLTAVNSFLSCHSDCLLYGVVKSTLASTAVSQTVCCGKGEHPFLARAATHQHTLIKVFIVYQLHLNLQLVPFASNGTLRLRNWFALISFSTFPQLLDLIYLLWGKHLLEIMLPCELRTRKSNE